MTTISVTCQNGALELATVAEKPLLKVVEVARRLNVSRAFAYSLMDRGELPYVKLGGTRRVPAEAVSQLIESNTVAAK
jgi:excisionase family DNA binding protein